MALAGRFSHNPSSSNLCRIYSSLSKEVLFILYSNSHHALRQYYRLCHYVYMAAIGDFYFVFPLSQNFQPYAFDRKQIIQFENTLYSITFLGRDISVLQVPYALEH